jgi:tRNA (cmo5U34)-methyltransferase
MDQNPVPLPGWDEQNSQDFIRYGRYFVPERERQMRTLVALLPEADQPGAVLDICCGEGLLSEAILEHRPAWTVYGLDGSTEMLRRAQSRLGRFAQRFQPQPFDLFDPRWPELKTPLHAAVSSLAIHHLDGPGKLALFSDVFALLAPGGVFLVADLVEPAHEAGWELAAREWDESVQERAGRDGLDDAFGAFERMRWNLYRHFDPDDIDRPSPLLDQLKWLETAGFKQVDAFWMRAGHAIFGGWKP